MPYKHQTDRLQIPRELKRSVKLTEAERRDIRSRHRDGQSIRQIARDYADRVCRRTIQFVIYPERARKVYENSNRNRDQYPCICKEKYAEYTRTHNRYKQRLKLAGKLIERPPEDRPKES